MHAEREAFNISKPSTGTEANTVKAEMQVLPYCACFLSLLCGENQAQTPFAMVGAFVGRPRSTEWFKYYCFLNHLLERC